jgi:hypothetical protein
MALRVPACDALAWRKQGRVCAFVGVFHDISDVWLLQSMMRRGGEGEVRCVAAKVRLHDVRWGVRCM